MRLLVFAFTIVFVWTGPEAFKIEIDEYVLRDVLPVSTLRNKQ